MARDFEYNDSADQDAKRARTAAKALRDILRKTFAQSGDARQTTEDLLRAVLGEVKIPREYANVILQQLNATRGELVRVVAGEVRTFLDEANLGEELAKILTSLSFEIRTEIRFIPNDEALRPSVKSRVGIKSARSSSKSQRRAAYDPHVNDEHEDEDDDFVETRGSAAIDKAIQSRIAALANVFLKGIVDIDDDEEDEHSRAWKDDHQEETSASAPTHPPIQDAQDEDVDDTEDLQKRSGFNPLNPRDYRMRVSLSPDIRRRAEAAASQVATAGRVTASLSAATAASAVSAAANRAQAVVRGSRNLTSQDARDAMWKKWVSPEEPDLVGNPVIGAPLDFDPADTPHKSPKSVRSRHDQPAVIAKSDEQPAVKRETPEPAPASKPKATPPIDPPLPEPSEKPNASKAPSASQGAQKSAAPSPSKAEAPQKSEGSSKSSAVTEPKSATPKPKKTASTSAPKADSTSTSKQTSASPKKTVAKAKASAPKKTAATSKSTAKTTARPKTATPAKKQD